MRPQLFAQLRAELGDFVTLSPLSDDGDHKATVPDDSYRMPSPRDPSESAPIARGRGPKRKGDTEGHLRALSKALDLVLDELSRVERRDDTRVKELEATRDALEALREQVAETLTDHEERMVRAEYVASQAEERAAYAGRLSLAAMVASGFTAAMALGAVLLWAWLWAYPGTVHVPTPVVVPIEVRR